MKRVATLMTIAAAALLCGCLKETLKVTVTPTDTPEAGVGYLAIGDLSVECVADRKQNDSGLEQDDLENRTLALAAATRAGEPNIDDFDCTILDKSGSEAIASFKYGERPSEPIELECNDYIFRMRSGEIPAAEWEHPVYGVDMPFTILRRETTTLDKLVCRLLQIQVSVSYSADLFDALSDDTTTKITVGGSSLDFVKGEKRSAFFAAPAALNNVDVLVKGLYTADGKEPSAFELTARIQNVKAGQYSDINLFVEYSDKGEINIGAKIDGWVADDEIASDFAFFLTEPALPDDDAGAEGLAIELAGGDIDTPVVAGDDSFDERGEYTGQLYIDIAAENCIAALEVEIDSDNAAFLASLAGYGIPQSFDMCNAGGAAQTLRLLGYKVNEEVAGAQAVSYNLAPQMKMLHQFGGTHTFGLTLRDSKGGKLQKVLTIEVVGGSAGVGAPVIEWKGYDIDQRQDITPELTAEITVDAPAGIKEFIVHVKSTILEPTLKELGHSNPISLITLTDAEAAFFGKDGGLGFPLGKEVENQTHVDISITQYLMTIGMLGEVGQEHDFELIVTDNNDATTVKSIMLRQIE